MNYFAHALPFLDRDPYFLAGTAVPDWLSVVDRSVRVRTRHARPIVDQTGDNTLRSVGVGALQHLADDAWFHGTRGFVEITSQVARSFREALGPDDPMRCGFLGHVVTELLLDAVLIEAVPRQLDRYYERLADADPRRIESSVNAIARGTTDRLHQFIPLFHAERFLYDYVSDSRLLKRLNAVLHRVGLSRLPETILPVLAAGRKLVRARWRELLPESHYPWRGRKPG